MTRQRPGLSVHKPGQSQANTGGVSFDITPGTAEVLVDGWYVGTVGEFTPTSRPLDLSPGRHRIEIRAPGFRTMDFDANISRDRLLPYQGAMQALRQRISRNDNTIRRPRMAA